MLMTCYISGEIQCLSGINLVEEARKKMIKQQLTHLPVVIDGKLLGNLSLKNIMKIPGKTLISQLYSLFELFFTYERTIIFDSIPVFTKNNTNLVPVINIEDQYLGCVCENELLEKVSHYPFLHDFGVFLVIETPISKPSISEIANIIEGNNGIILGLIVIEQTNNLSRITLKIKSENLASIGDTFVRFGYHIINQYYDDFRQDLLKNRFDQLLKFIEI